MLEEFDIHIKDNFLDKEIYKSIYDKIPFYTYSGNYGYHNIEGTLIKEQNFMELLLKKTYLIM
jgi:hypothetical protein